MYGIAEEVFGEPQRDAEKYIRRYFHEKYEKIAHNEHDFPDPLLRNASRLHLGMVHR